MSDIKMSDNTDGISDILLGKKLGEGHSRSAYVCDIDHTKVIKIANGFDGISDNCAEYELWCKTAYNGTFYDNLNKWLAPIYSISNCGRFLVMARTYPVSDERLPTVIPALFTDLQRVNIGMYKDKVVFHDYALNLILESAIDKPKAKIIKPSVWI